MNYQGIEDNYLPSVPKPSLQQYDNYQIYDLYCDDIEYLPPVNYPANTKLPDNVLLQNFLAVERASPFGFIDCNFEAITLMYP